MADSGDFLLMLLISWGTPFLLFLFVIFDYFLCTQIKSVLLVGITAGSVEPLPHVKKYQTVIPQRLQEPSPINDAAAHQVRHKLLFNYKQIV